MLQTTSGNEHTFFLVVLFLVLNHHYHSYDYYYYYHYHYCAIPCEECRRWGDKWGGHPCPCPCPCPNVLLLFFLFFLYSQPLQ